MKLSHVTYVENKIGTDWVLNNPNGTVGRFITAGARKVRDAARVQAGIRTGALKASMHFSVERAAAGPMAKIGSPLPYAAAHHEGTRPHLITGRNGGMLRFTQSGRVVYTRAVVHPGTRPNKYLADNLWLVYTPSLSNGAFL